MMRLIGIVSAAALLGLAACTPSEGDRCNPLLFSDECPSPMHCTVPANCAAAFCCPDKVGPKDSPNCQACPSDGGTDNSGDGGTDDGATASDMAVPLDMTTPSDGGVDGHPRG
jgi:hypothetical protein